jgi:hypothetical protein
MALKNNKSQDSGKHNKEVCDDKDCSELECEKRPL